jgi:hypothetical protein
MVYKLGVGVAADAAAAPVLADVPAEEEQDVALPRRVAQKRRNAVLVRRVDGGDQQVLRRQPQLVTSASRSATGSGRGHGPASAETRPCNC